jgi:hypothetical protein
VLLYICSMCCVGGCYANVNVWLHVGPCWQLRGQRVVLMRVFQGHRVRPSRASTAQSSCRLPMTCW